MLEPLVSLMSRFGACSGRIRGDRHTDTQTHRASTVTLAAHAHRGLIKRYHDRKRTHGVCYVLYYTMRRNYNFILEGGRMDILRKACGVRNDILQPSRSCAESVLFSFQCFSFSWCLLRSDHVLYTNTWSGFVAFSYLSSWHRR